MLPHEGSTSKIKAGSPIIHMMSAAMDNNSSSNILALDRRLGTSPTSSSNNNSNILSIGNGNTYRERAPTNTSIYSQYSQYSQFSPYSRGSNFNANNNNSNNNSNAKSLLTTGPTCDFNNVHVTSLSQVHGFIIKNYFGPVQLYLIKDAWVERGEGEFDDLEFVYVIYIYIRGVEMSK